jgi:hypothetical protein
LTTVFQALPFKPIKQFTLPTILPFKYYLEDVLRTQGISFSFQILFLSIFFTQSSVLLFLFLLFSKTDKDKKEVGAEEAIDVSEGGNHEGGIRRARDSGGIMVGTF